MRTDCTQCGASLQVLDRDYFIRCPYCEARILLDYPGGLPSAALPVLSEEMVRRRFPQGAVKAMRLLYFPYLEVSGVLQPFFSQPRPELESHRPPASARNLLSSCDIDPDDLIPVSGVPEGSRIVYHPFREVRLQASGFDEILLVDAVSGAIPGRRPSLASEAPPPSRSFFGSLTVAFPAAVAATALAIAAGARPWDVLAASIAAALLSGGAYLYLKVLR